MPLRHRLDRLTRRLGPAPARCPACRGRWGVPVFVTCRQAADGTVVREEPGPPPCLACGQVPESVCEIVEIVVASRDDVARWIGDGGPPCP